jgi:ADP-ribose pyrophosphatase YjhB (NUDIX family)
MTRDPSADPRFEQQEVPGDDRPRLVCRACGFVQYVNPRLVTGTVVADEDGRILLGRREIEPASGRWTLPGGFLEEGESLQQGAIRETLEEVGLRVALRRLLGIYSLVPLSLVLHVFEATPVGGEARPGHETSEVRWFPPAEIPWEDLAFPSTEWALRVHDRHRGDPAAPVVFHPEADSPRPAGPHG